MEDALQKRHPVPDEAAVRGRVLRKNVEAPDLAAVKDFLRFHAATSNGKIQEEVTCNSLNTFAEWFFAGFSRATDTPTNDNDRREIYDVSASYRLWKAPISPSSMGPESFVRRTSWSISGGQSIFLLNEMLTCYVPRGRRMESIRCWNQSGAGINSAGMSPVLEQVQCRNKSSGRQPSSIATDTLSKL